MSLFKRGILASAILALSSGGYAMESMNDQALSEATGQQGLTITTSLSIASTGKVVYTDSDGLASSATYSKSGDLVITGFGMTGSMVTTIDVGGDGLGTAASNAVLNIGITGTSNLVQTFSTISVISTSADGANNPNLGGTTAGVLSNIITTTGSQSITINSGYTVNIQLGGGATTFMSLTGVLGTITLGSTAVTSGAYSGGTNNVKINDVPDGGILGVGGVSVSGVGLGTTAAPTTVGLCKGTVVGACQMTSPTGIEINLTTDTTGSGVSNVGLTVANITAGSTTSAALGSLYISGLNLAGTKVLIAGH